MSVRVRSSGGNMENTNEPVPTLTADCYTCGSTVSLNYFLIFSRQQVQTKQNKTKLPVNYLNKSSNQGSEQPKSVCEGKDLHSVPPL